MPCRHSRHLGRYRSRCLVRRWSFSTQRPSIPSGPAEVLCLHELAYDGSYRVEGGRLADRRWDPRQCQCRSLQDCETGGQR
ncbi:MAG TPA: hypothetical protein DGN59_16005, partial [Candidatus Latescibacteria bacterium]|nr:hypothetical protein [Candidatus Latescibacterota bacterium]